MRHGGGGGEPARSRPDTGGQGLHRGNRKAGNRRAQRGRDPGERAPKAVPGRGEGQGVQAAEAGQEGPAQEVLPEASPGKGEEAQRTPAEEERGAAQQRLAPTQEKGDRQACEDPEAADERVRGGGQVRQEDPRCSENIRGRRRERQEDQRLGGFETEVDVRALQPPVPEAVPRLHRVAQSSQSGCGVREDPLREVPVDRDVF